MVALQILVLSVQVRILVSQRIREWLAPLPYSLRYLSSYPRASHHPEGYWEKPCFSVRLRSGLEWRMPPFRVEMKVVSPSRLATALKGTGKGFPESPSVASLLVNANATRYR